MYYCLFLKSKEGRRSIHIAFGMAGYFVLTLRHGIAWTPNNGTDESVMIGVFACCIVIALALIANAVS